MISVFRHSTIRTRTSTLPGMLRSLLRCVTSFHLSVNISRSTRGINHFRRRINVINFKVVTRRVMYLVNPHRHLRGFQVTAQGLIRSLMRNFHRKQIGPIKRSRRYPYRNTKRSCLRVFHMLYIVLRLLGNLRQPWFRRSGATFSNGFRVEPVRWLVGHSIISDRDRTYPFTTSAFYFPR